MIRDCIAKLSFGLSSAQIGKMTTMLSKRRGVWPGALMTAAVLLAAPRADAQTAPDLATMPLDQLAKAIAQTVETSTPRTPAAPLTFDNASVDGAKVMIHFTVKDAATLDKIKAQADHLRETMASHFCRNPQRAIPLKRGISMVYVHELADHSDRLAVTIDAATCAALPPVTAASPAELTQMADQVASELRLEKDKAQQAGQGLMLKQVDAQGGVVSPHYAVTAPAFEDFYRANIAQVKGMIKGAMCSRYGDDIRRGLRFHLIYEQIDTSAFLSEVDVGPSDC